MTSFKEYPLDNDTCYEFVADAPVNTKRFNRTTKNIASMLAEGCKIILVVPDEPLSEEELLRWKKHFCQKAKKDGVNYIYFEVPVHFNEILELDGTMFAI